MADLGVADGVVHGLAMSYGDQRQLPARSGGFAASITGLAEPRHSKCAVLEISHIGSLHIISILIISLLMNHQMPPAKNLALLMHDVSRLLRRRLDKEAQAIGLTSAQWRVLAYLSRCEGRTRPTSPTSWTWSRSRSAGISTGCRRRA